MDVKQTEIYRTAKQQIEGQKTADLLNALIYHGKEVVRAENLLPGPTETIYQGREKLRSQYEDLGRYMIEDGHVRLMYLISNQTRTDGKMLLRKAGYVGGRIPGAV